jgi:protein CpxP
MYNRNRKTSIHFLKHHSMKNLFRIASFLASALIIPVTVSQATALQQEQGQKPQRTPEERATEVSNKLNTDLGLNADQKKKVYDAALLRAQKMEQARSQAGGDKVQVRTLMKPVNDEYDASLKGILTSDQYSKWKADAKQRQVRKPGQ